MLANDALINVASDSEADDMPPKKGKAKTTKKTNDQGVGTDSSMLKLRWEASVLTPNPPYQ